MRLRNLLVTLEKSIGTWSLARSGKFLLSHRLNASDILFANSWIIGSEAIDHMTHSSRNFSKYVPCPSSRKVAPADGSLTVGAGVGDVKISLSFILRNVFHVPKFTNLVSINKVSHDMDCKVTFFPTYCVFQDQGSG